MTGASQRAHKLAGQVLHLIRYSTKHGGITLSEIATVLCTGNEAALKHVRRLCESGKVRIAPSGRFVATPPKAGEL